MGPGVLSQHAGARPNVWAGVDLEAVAARVQTPAYVYSAPAIRDRYGRLTIALAGIPHRVHYSVKANGNLAVLALLQELGAGVDIVSGGELFRALQAGFDGTDVVFSGVGKTEAELGEALDAGVLMFNLESEGELRLLASVAAARGVVASVAFRVNPEVEVDAAHHYIGTGRRGDKFGIPFDEIDAVARVAASLTSIHVIGLAMHIGSQLAAMGAFEQAVLRVRGLVEVVRAAGHTGLRFLDLGGGLAVRYADADPTPDLDSFARIAREAVADTGLTLLIEPGRFLVAESGVLLTRVLYRKHSGGKEYVIVDAGMTELLRPSHYAAYHPITAATPRAERITADVVGPVCESGDFLALDRSIEAVQPGDLLLVHNAGAYGFVMSSTYNARPRVAEVMVDGDRWAVVRERERYDDLIRGETAAPSWRSL